jgi:hypothetical protein
MKGFLNKAQQKKGAGGAEGKPALSIGGEGNVRVDISLPKTQRRYLKLHMKALILYVVQPLLKLNRIELMLFSLSISNMTSMTFNEFQSKVFYYPDDTKSSSDQRIAAPFRNPYAKKRGNNS